MKKPSEAAIEECKKCKFHWHPGWLAALLQTPFGCPREYAHVCTYWEASCVQANKGDCEHFAWGSNEQTK